MEVIVHYTKNEHDLYDAELYVRIDTEWRKVATLWKDAKQDLFGQLDAPYELCSIE